uniref:amino acid adenylation domain-containing protein n=1 Tax=Ascidiimonas meishanensis TaxID=3128903 RepID=UPI0030EB9C2C
MKSKTKLHLAQQEVYYGQFMNPKSPLYNIGGFTILKGIFNPILFKGIIEDLSFTFDSFHIRFDFSGEEPLCYFKDKPEKVLVDELDFSLESDPRKKAKSWMQDQFNNAFDLSQEKLYVFVLIKIAENEYWFFKCFHHLMTDGIGFSIIIDFLLNEYEQQLEGNQKPIEIFPSYYEAIRNSLDYMQSEQYAKDAMYWKEKYSSVPNPLVVYKKQNKTGVGKFSCLITESDGELFDRLTHQTKANVAQLTIAALLLYLGKTTNEKDFSFGIPIHNRGTRADRKTLGMFSGILPFKGEYIPEQPLSEFISDIRKTQRNDYRHRSYPISHLNRYLKLLSENRLHVFDIIINYLAIPFPKSLSSGFSSESKLLTSTLDTEVPLNIWWCYRGKNSSMELNVDYQQKYFDHAEVERIVKRLFFIIRQFQYSLDKPVKDIAILPLEETYQLLNTFNDTAVDYLKDKTLVDLFQEQVQKTPENIAVVFQDIQVSYKELDQQSNQLARYLLKNQVKQEDLIAICLERSLEMIVGILGILKAGAAYLPIDPEYPIERINYMIQDSEVDLVLTSKNSYQNLETIDDMSMVLLDGKHLKDIQKETIDPLHRIAYPENLAYVIYTSGSTGKPKGVMVEHQSIVNTILAQIPAFSITNADHCLQFANPAFDASVSEIFTALISGSRLCIITEKSKSDTFSFKNFIANNHITIATLPPAFLQLLSVKDLKSLHTLVTAGEPIPLELAKTFAEHYHYINAYGPTETSICATTFNGTIVDSVPIGSPIANTQIYILSEQQELVPIGVVGELCISGAGVARGYLNNEKLTQEKFIENPFVEGERIYKTGDLARWLPDGNIEFIGRIDDQVKIRGYRIELGGIETALTKIKGVSASCVLAKEDAKGNKRLVGYLVMGETIDKKIIQDTLKQSLPEYMVPTIWVELESMPLNSSGKLDKKALPDPDTSLLSNREYVPPRNQTEQTLVAIWQELLGIDKVGVHDNFFELGGHSLLATRLVSMIRKQLDMEITIKDVFAHKTIASLEGLISEQTAGTLLPAMVAEDRPKNIPLSFSQERLWFLDQLEGSLAYHIPMVIQLKGSLNIFALEKALKSIISRHEVLRTLIHSENGVGYQQIISEDNWDMEHALIAHKDSLDSLLDAYLDAPFDLSIDYKLRVCLYEMENQNYVLACVFHHIASDGWSNSIWIRELLEVYNAIEEGRNPKLPLLTLQYADYAIWQRTYLEGDILENQLAYWQDKLKGSSILALPTDYPRPAIQSTSGASISLSLDKELSDSIKGLCRAEDVTPFMFLLAAFKVLLFRYSGQTDICVGTPIANRTQTELEGMIGFFVNTLTLRSDLSGNIGFSELLAQVKETTLQSYDHQLAPFEKVVERVVDTRDMSTSALFQVMFVLQNTPDLSKEKDLSLGNLKLSQYEFTNTTSKYDITLNAVEQDNGISLTMEYCTDLYHKTTIERMIVHYRELLVSIVNDINQPINQLGFLPEEENHLLLEVFNDTQVSYPKNKTLVDLFEQQVQKTPENIAVVFENTQLSYQQLDQQSN